MTAVGDTQTAVQAMKVGAFDYITKPFDIEKVNDSVESALRRVAVCDNKTDSPGNDAEVRVAEGDWISYLDDIARGVEARYEILTGHTVMITEGTVAIARGLNIPVEQIEKWMEVRQEQYARMMSAMNSLLTKLERNPVAQIEVGVTKLYQFDSSNEQFMS